MFFPLRVWCLESAYRVMAIKIKIRISRKVVIILSAATVLFGASGAAALYLGREAILGPSKKSIYGLECEDVVRIADVRGRELPWLRKYIRVESTDGKTRLKTALRVAEYMREHLPAELIHIAVLDESGPEIRAQMRGRAFGAEVFVVPGHSPVPGIEGEFKGYYYEGKAAADGVFYGEKTALSEGELRQMASLMEETEDCTPPESDEAAAGETSGHGGGGEAAVDHGGGEKASGHGESNAGGHGADAEGGTGESANAGHEGSAEPGFFGKMLNMVGLGPDETAGQGEGLDGAGHGEVDGHGTDAGHAGAENGHGGDAGHGEDSAGHGGADDHAVEMHGESEHPLEQTHGENASGGSHQDHSGDGPQTAHAEKDVHSEADVAEHVGEEDNTHMQAAASHEGVKESALVADEGGHKSKAVETDTVTGHEAPQEHKPDVAEHAVVEISEAVKMDAHATVEEHVEEPAEEETHEATVEPVPEIEAWDGGQNGEIVIHDGPSDTLILGWEDDTLDDPSGDSHAEATPEIDPAPVSSVKGDAHKDTADH